VCSQTNSRFVFSAFSCLIYIYICVCVFFFNINVSPRLKEDAKACIAAVDGFYLEGRSFRASFGTTKYCNTFLRHMPCSNPDCLYLHELGDDDDSFTKEQVCVFLIFVIFVSRIFCLYDDLNKCASSHTYIYIYIYNS
jgi:hypothetical protein